ncbi:hypothetical protein BAXH7_00725 [Bacillus amyloliquefaciens XH7]|nr:hypothetical protein LL3_00780 [Bacillus amyloliquefaciens LL3]AEK87870.1 hypothetical protein BAXH7_00725 [Bacillus amyloliquefaciens XH7]KYC97566.1 hypothetical protein B425_0710 [Bacillus amyloliquefaciens]
MHSGYKKVVLLISLEENDTYRTFLQELQEKKITKIHKNEK